MTTALQKRGELGQKIGYPTDLRKNRKKKLKKKGSKRVRLNNQEEWKGVNERGR